jgi:hypothetical protein
MSDLAAFLLIVGGVWLLLTIVGVTIRVRQIRKERESA